MPQNSQDDKDPSNRDLIARVRAEDRDALNALSKQTLEQLKLDIARQLPSRLRRHADEDDLANSVMKSFFRGVAAERFPRLEDDNDLWQILGMLTRQKLAKYIRSVSAQKRGSGNVRGNSVFVGQHDRNAGFDTMPSQSKDGLEEFTQLESMRTYLQMLPNDGLREIALLKLEGYENHEIAVQQKTSVRTIGRRLQTIRECWSGLFNSSPG